MALEAESRGTWPWGPGNMVTVLQTQLTVAIYQYFRGELVQI